MVVLAVLSLFICVAQMNLFGALRRATFKGQVQSFMSAMQLAASTAAESDRRFEMIVDLNEQSFLLREITSNNLADVLDEEIIQSESFGENCRLAYVELDNGEYTNDGRARFRVGHAGWRYGGKIVFLDEKETPHTVVVSRLTLVIELVDGDPELIRLKSDDEVPFS
jgi:hypothetical protein